MSVVGSSPSRSSSIIHFLHPESGCSLKYVAAPDSSVDLGTIAAFFSLDPCSVRLNGHFISSDGRFVSSLTWFQVLTFFHDRGFGSGTKPSAPVIVAGKPLRLQNSVGTRKEDFSRDPLQSKDDNNAAYESNSRVKRMRLDTCSEVQAVQQHKPKRWLCEEPTAPNSCGKRSRCDAGNASTHQNEMVRFYDEKNETVGSKRQLIGVDGSNYGPLCKRLKEISA